MFTNGLKRKSYDVIVIGAGIQGSCLAFELGKRGVKNVLLILRCYRPLRRRHSYPVRPQAEPGDLYRLHEDLGRSRKVHRLSP